ncbi:hypothetical protein, partial [Brevibacillus borstelensis]|uniref:hypothetical protein n=1 Tax=Brevibacillus borstelensis TaxID=45462 RepID=UPI001FA9C129
PPASVPPNLKCFLPVSSPPLSREHPPFLKARNNDELQLITSGNSSHHKQPLTGNNELFIMM